MADADGIRTLAFYLPQYSPTPENERWWGRGFSEWTNVLGARPLWDGHRQPRLPRHLGVYDLRTTNTIQEQADLARAYNIHAFGIYHYWSDGHRVLGRLLDQMLASSEPDFPFFLAWGNHRWSRKWDGTSRGVLLEQVYSAEDDRNHATFLGRVFSDSRYVRVLGRPLFAIHCPGQLPEPASYLARFRRLLTSACGEEPYLVMGESQPGDAGMAEEWGFDAAYDFQPSLASAVPLTDPRMASVRVRAQEWELMKGHEIYDYAQSAATAVRNVTARAEPPYVYPCVMPDWDNTPRRPHDPASIFLGSTPEVYRRWVQSARAALSVRPPEERLLFVNGWNEWGEGAHLEPDDQWGLAYLEAHLP